MTMHLVRGMTSLNTKKRKTKLSTGKLARLQEEHRAHTKQMKRMNCHSMIMTFDDYVDYVQGNYKPKTAPQAVQLDWQASGNYRRETAHIPSKSSDSFAPCTVKERKVYSGERKLVGIATMHKSNMVPVFADEDDKTGSKQATEIAQMRRN